VSADPEAAFRARLRRDRTTLIELSATFRQPTAWTRAAGRLAAIEHVAHGLAGAAGVFGFTDLGEDAARLERLLERWRKEPPAEISSQRITALGCKLAPILDKLRSASGAP
jgi:HPt (histidine-containing phosphotransfer) domain-containing protein